MKPRRLHSETITSMVAAVMVLHGGPELAPIPPTLVAPRRSRGALRSPTEAPNWPPRPPPLGRASAKPGRASGLTQNVSSPLSGHLGQPPYLAQELRSARRLANQSCHVCFQRRPQLGLDAAEGLGQRLLPARRAQASQRGHRG